MLWTNQIWLAKSFKCYHQRLRQRFNGCFFKGPKVLSGQLFGN